jgi:hypothetical protein
MSVVQAKMDELRENPGTPFRPPAVAVLTIDSRDRVQIDPATGYRIDTTTPYQILINKQQSVMNGFFTRIGLTEVNMQYNSPNVIDEGPQKNNTLLFEQGAALGASTVVASRRITVPGKFYTPNELADTIQDLLNAGAGTFGGTAWGVVYLEDSNSFSLTSDDVNIPFRIRPENIGFNDDLCNLMGLSYPSPLFTKDLIGSYASMQYTPYFDIVSDNLTKKQNVRDNGTSFLTGQNLLARVYLTVEGTNILRERSPALEPQLSETNILGCRPFTLYRQYQTPKQIYWDAQEFINVIDLRLIDYKGRTLYSKPQFTQGTSEVQFCGEAAQFQLTLQVTET